LAGLFYYLDGSDPATVGAALKRNEMTSRPFGTDSSAATEDSGSPDSDNPSGASDGTDWESEDNPYKKRVSGLDTANAKLTDQLEEARKVSGLIESLQGNVRSLTNRVAASEDLVAEGIDATTAATRAQQERDGVLDANDDPAGPSRLVQTRQARANESRVESINRYNADLNNLWRDGMANDPTIVEITTRWRAIVNANGSQDHEIASVLSDMRSVATEYDERAAADNPPAQDNDNNARGSGDGDGEDPGDDDSNSGSDDVEDDDDEPTARERNAASSESITGGNGQSAGLNEDTMTPLQKMAAHEEGKKPAGQ
tara:strand:+ start:605 stop:1546 length:942 start_codon:yes stop_codon:yes gene_type:complete